MYCPGCGTEDNGVNQFCRACGSDLRTVRTALESPDSVTGSAVSARQEIGRAFAERIRSSKSSDLGTIAEEVLPEVEKFLESPEERRLRRIRQGTIVAFIGFAAAFAFLIVSTVMREEGITFLAGLGVVAFAIGVSLIINGLFLSVPKRAISDRSSEGDRQRELDGEGTDMNDLLMPASADHEFRSVTEGTTRHLKKTPVEKE